MLNLNRMKYYFVFKNLKILVLTLFIIGFISCKSDKDKKEEVVVSKESVQEEMPFFKLSLAQWSFNKHIRNGEMSSLDFAQKAKEMGFEGLEYVSQLYSNYLTKGDNPKAAMQNLLDTLKMKSEKYGLRNLGIMVDNEGDLSSPDEEKRMRAVENHKKWIDAGHFLGCYYIRVNLFGSDNPKIWMENSVKSLKQLAAYAKEKSIDVIVENHGYLSSNTPYLIQVINKVNMSNCGVLPDFGNFCLKREGGERWNTKCIEEYNKYKGVAEMMPAAKAVSAKSYDFDQNGNETTIDYLRMLQIVKDAGYTGFIGVEYEGNRLNEEDGIIATKELLLNTAKKLN